MSVQTVLGSTLTLAYQNGYVTGTWTPTTGFSTLVTNATQTAPTGGTFANGNTKLTFNGSNTSLSVTGNNATNHYAELQAWPAIANYQRMMFMLAAPASGAVSQSLMQMNNEHFTINSSGKYEYVTNIGVTAKSNSVVNDATLRTVILIGDDSSKVITMYINGVAQTTTGTGFTTGFGTPADYGSSSVTVGSDSDGSASQVYNGIMASYGFAITAAGGTFSSQTIADLHQALIDFSTIKTGDVADTITIGITNDVGDTVNVEGGTRVPGLFTQVVRTPSETGTLEGALFDAGTAGMGGVPEVAAASTSGVVYTEDLPDTPIAVSDTTTTAFGYERLLSDTAIAVSDSVTAALDSSVNPATLGLTGWWRDFSGLPQAGTASTGISGSESLISDADDPTFSGTLNGHGLVNFGGGTQHLLTADPVSTFFTASAWSLWALIKVNSLSSGHINLIADDPDQWFIIEGSNDTSTGLLSFANNQWNSSLAGGAGDYAGATALNEAPVGTWVFLQAKYDGTNLSLRIDAGAWVRTATTSLEVLSNQMRLGYTSQQSLADFGTTNFALSDTQFNRIYAYARQRYNLPIDEDTGLDTLAVSDTDLSNLEYGRSGSDTLAVTDSVSDGAVYGRAISDTIAVTDAVTLNLEYGRALSDTAACTDSLTKEVQYLRTLSDTAAVIDLGNTDIEDVFDPGTLALTAWWREYPGSTSWTSDSSAGVSGGYQTTGGVAPSSGTLNGHATDVGNGSTQYLQAGVASSNFVSASSFSGWALVNVSAIATNNSSWSANDSIVCTSGTGEFGVFLKDNSGTRTVGLAVFNGTFGDQTVAATFATGAWQLVQFKGDGTNIKIRVNNGTWVSATGNAILSLSAVLDIGRNPGQTHFLNGTIAELALSQSVISDTNFTSIYSYTQDRYFTKKVATATDTFSAVDDISAVITGAGTSVSDTVTYTDQSFTDVYTPSTFNPATLGLTGWWRDLVTPNEVGTPSAGVSGSHILSTRSPARSAPSVGSPLNGHGTLSYGTSTGTVTDSIASTFISASAFSCWALLDFSNPSNSAGFNLFYDLEEWMYVDILVNSSGTSFQLEAGIWKSSIGDYVVVDSPSYPINRWALCQIRYDGTNLSVRVGANPWTNVASLNVEVLTPVFTVLGDSLATTGAMLAADVAVSNTSFSDAQFNQVKSYVDERYALQQVATASDTISLLDSATIEVNRSPADTLTVTDSSLLSSVYGRLLSDTPAVTDTETSNLEYSRSASDTIAATDSITTGLELLRALSDTVSVTDSAVITDERSPSDSITATDSSSISLEYGRALTDTAAITDSPSIEDNRSPADSVAASDSTFTGVERGITLSDTCAITDSRTSEVSKGCSDSISNTDSLSVGNEYLKTLSDTAIVTDNTYITDERSPSESISVTDLGSTSVERGVLLSVDTASVTDSAVLTIERSPSDTVSVTDTILRDVYYAPQISDVVGTTDQVQLLGQIQVDIADTAAVTDSLATEVPYVRSGSDAVLLTESPLVNSEIGRSAGNDTYAVTDSCVSERSLERVGADTLALTDSLTTQLYRVISEVLSDSGATTDSLALEKYTSLSLNDTLALTETQTVEVDHLLTFSDSISITDSVQTAANQGLDIQLDEVALNVTEVLIVAQEKNLTFTDFSAITDSCISVANKLFTVALSDSLSTTETTATSLVFGLSTSDSLTILDVGSTSKVIGLLPSDLVAVTDSPQATIEKSRAVLDTLALLDLLSVTGSYERSLPESIIVTEDVLAEILRKNEIQVEADDLIDSDDSLDLATSLSITVADSFGTLDSAISLYSLELSIGIFAYSGLQGTGTLFKHNSTRQDPDTRPNPKPEPVGITGAYGYIYVPAVPPSTRVTNFAHTPFYTVEALLTVRQIYAEGIRLSGGGKVYRIRHSDVWRFDIDAKGYFIKEGLLKPYRIGNDDPTLGIQVLGEWTPITT